eukprot:1153410-Pelagomonas_calceolata.AAC.3
MHHACSNAQVCLQKISSKCSKSRGLRVCNVMVASLNSSHQLLGTYSQRRCCAPTNLSCTIQASPASGCACLLLVMLLGRWLPQLPVHEVAQQHCPCSEVGRGGRGSRVLQAAGAPCRGRRHEAADGRRADRIKWNLENTVFADGASGPKQHCHTASRWILFNAYTRFRAPPQADLAQEERGRAKQLETGSYMLPCTTARGGGEGGGMFETASSWQA